eukprot:798209-Pleurochrysis_carterae.AAC.1
MHGEALKQQRAAASAKQKELLQQMQRDDLAKKVTDLEVRITNLRRMLNHAHAAARAANKKNASAVTELETELQRAKEERIWARVREEVVKRVRAEETSRSSSSNSSSSSWPAARRWPRSRRSWPTCAFGARHTRKRWRATRASRSLARTTSTETASPWPSTRRCGGHHHCARLAQLGAGPLPDLCALLSHQAADPPPQSVVQGRRRQDDARREGAALRPGHPRQGDCAKLNQAHKLQVGTQLLEADDGYC